MGRACDTGNGARGGIAVLGQQRAGAGTGAGPQPKEGDAGPAHRPLPGHGADRLLSAPSVRIRGSPLQFSAEVRCSSPRKAVVVAVHVASTNPQPAPAVSVSFPV